MFPMSEVGKDFLFVIQKKGSCKGTGEEIQELLGLSCCLFEVYPYSPLQVGQKDSFSFSYEGTLYCRRKGPFGEPPVHTAEACHYFRKRMLLIN